MSQVEKLLIPLIDDNISISDVQDERFVGVFTEDINMPGVDYIYLVFLYNIENLHPNLGKNGIDNVRQIGDNLYHIYKFPKQSVDLKRLLNGEYQLVSNEGISKIYNFWKDIDTVTANYPFSRAISTEQYKQTIPEEKYVPLCKNEKPQGLIVERQ